MAGVYRTLDTYTIRLSQPIHQPSLETFCRILEECDLIRDFRNCCDAIADGMFEFTASCSYKTYKKFFSVFYQFFGPFTAKVSFSEDFPPPDCAYNTTVDLVVDGHGDYGFALLNVLSMREQSGLSEECKNRRHSPQAPFEANCEEQGNISEWTSGGSHLKY